MLFVATLITSSKKALPNKVSSERGKACLFSILPADLGIKKEETARVDRVLVMMPLSSKFSLPGEVCRDTQHFRTGISNHGNL